MSDLFSELERNIGSEAIDLKRKTALHSVLKHEVGIVQSGRRSKAVQDNRHWNDSREDYGDGDTGTKVIKMGGRILKSQPVLEEERSDIEHKSMMVLLNRFCIQNRIPLLSESIGQERSGGGRQSKSRSKATSRDQNAPTDGGGTYRHSSSNSQRTRGERTSASGAGGGRRPNRVPSSSEPDSAFNLQVSDTSEQVISSSAEVSTEISDNGMKRKLSKEEQSGHSEHRKGSSKRRKTRRTLDVAETSDSLYPQTSSASPSLSNQTKIRSGKSVQIEGGGKSEGGHITLEKKPQKELRRRSSYRKKLKNRKTLLEAEDPVYIANMSDISNVARKERADEWLEWTSSEDVAHDEDEEEQAKEKKGREDLLDKRKFLPQVQTDLKFFLNSTKLLDRINSILGLNPYTKEVRSNYLVQVKWVPRSGEYIGVCLNALLFFVTTISIFYSLIVILGYEEPLQTTRKIVKIAFAHHFLEALFLMLLTLFLTIWAVSCILELGVHYAEFYNRFNLAISLTKYDVTEGIHEMIVKHLANIFLFELIILILFFLGYFHTSIVRESCGFLGYTILRPFNFELRESIYYPLCELFGLILFLYSFLCLNVVLLHFAVYAKALANMARRFNLRMAYAFGSLTEKYESGEAKAIRKVIPFKKLFAEHQIITSLIRNISQVNAIVFGAFIFSMICEIVLVMWLFFDIILEEHPPYLEGVSIRRTENVELAVPLRMQKTEGERLMKSFVIFAITWLTYWIFGGVLHNAGEALHIGIEYVRRQGLLRCKSSKERRFVLSMMSSFSSKTPYWIGRQFHFTRTSFVALVSFVIGASMVTVAFRPDRLSLTSIENCNEYGECISVKIYKSAENLLYATLDIAAPPPSTSPQPIGIILPTESPIDVNKTDLYPHLSFLHTPPCVSYGVYPLISSVMSGKVPTEWSFLPELKLPFVYDPVHIPPGPLLYQPQDSTMSFLHTYLQDCYQKEFKRDSCYNPRLLLPSLSNFTGKVAPPELQLIAVNQIPDYPKNDERFFCCYKYSLSTEKEVKVCNLKSKAEIERRCKRASTYYDYFNSTAEKLKQLRREGSGARDDLASEVPYNDPIRMSWTACLCYKNGSECLKLNPKTTVKPSASSTKKPTTKPPQISPTCTHLPKPPATSVIDKFFIKCPIPSKSGPWKDLDYIAHPFIYEKLNGGGGTSFALHLKLKATCDPDVEGKPLPRGTFDGSLKTEVLYDCSQHDYSRGSGYYFEDECSNPILSSPGSHWEPGAIQLIRVVILPTSTKRVACCIDYRMENETRSRMQALVCNNNEDVSFKCEDKSDGIRKLCLDSYIKKWRQLGDKKRKILESDGMVVKCMCNRLEYVEKKYSQSANLQICLNHINSF